MSLLQRFGGRTLPNLQGIKGVNTGHYRRKAKQNHNQTLTWAKLSATFVWTCCLGVFLGLRVTS